MNYNMTNVEVGAIQFVFVTRGKAKPFSKKEIKVFFAENSLTENRWVGIPDNKQRKLMFISDLKLGLDFCVAKYGATKPEILSEAKRIAPYLNTGD